jgi:hypothetical protein
MNAIQVHLFLSHLPIFGIIIGGCVLTYGYITKNKSIKKVGLVIYIAMCIATIPVYISGEETEIILKNNASFSKELIEIHIDHAEKAIWLVGLLALASIYNLYTIYKGSKTEKLATQLTLTISILTLGILMGTAQHGGEIKHDEIRKHHPNETISNQISLLKL